MQVGFVRRSFEGEEEDIKLCLWYPFSLPALLSRCHLCLSAPYRLTSPWVPRERIILVILLGPAISVPLGQGSPGSSGAAPFPNGCCAMFCSRLATDGSPLLKRNGVLVNTSLQSRSGLHWNLFQEMMIMIKWRF